MWQIVERLKLQKIKTAQTGVLYTPDIPANFRLSIFGSISASPSAAAPAVKVGTAGFKVTTSDNFGAENDVSIDLVSSSVASNSFAIGILQAGASVPLSWAVKLTTGFPTDCDFSIYAILEQDVEEVNSI